MRRAVALAAGLVLLFGAASDAGEFNYQNPIIGERAVGMGGAATAVADDASASYYNPAGLAQTMHTSLSLSATVVQFRYQTIGDFLGPDGIDQWSLSIIAASWSWVTDLWGGRFALSMYVPDAADFDMDTQFVTDLPMSDGSRLVSAHLIRRFNSETYMGGPSMAWAIGEKWALGASAFVAYTSCDLLLDDTYLYSTRALTQVMDVESGGMVGLRGHVGILFRPIPELQLGLAGKLGFHAVEWGSRRRLRIQSFADDPESFSRTNMEEGQGVQFKEKTEEVETKEIQGVALGVAWQVSHELLLALDATLWSPVEFERRKKTIVKEATWNLALGGEWRIYPDWPLRFGLFTNNSAAPDIDRAVLSEFDPTGSSRLDLPPDKIDYYGCSLSLGNLTSSSTMDVALQFVIGLGDHVELLETGATVHDIFDWSVSLTVSGSYIFVDDSEEEEHRLQEQLERQEEESRRRLREEPSPWEELQKEREKKPPADNEWKRMDAPS